MGYGEKGKILVLAPHPVDAPFFCEEKLRRLSKDGGFLTVVFVSNGDSYSPHDEQTLSGETRRELARIRREKAIQWLNAVGAKHVYFVDEQADRIATNELLLNENWDAIFCPWPNHFTSETSRTFECLTKILMHCKKQTSVWLYEVFSPYLSNTESGGYFVASAAKILQAAEKGIRDFALGCHSRLPARLPLENLRA